MSASLKLTLKVKQMSDYGMFTEHGNNAIRLLIQNAQVHNLTWLDVYKELQELSNREGYEEAMDTAVREVVYDALCYKDNFYDV
jgi:hypothetical protein